MPGWRGPSHELQSASSCLSAHGVGERAALVGGRPDPQQVPDLVEHVGAHHLPEEVVRDRLEAGEAARARRRSWGRWRAARPPSPRGSWSIARLRSSRLWSSWRSGLAVAGASAARRRSSSSSFRPSRSAWVAGTAAVPSSRSAGRAVAANGPRRFSTRLHVRRGALEVGQQRLALARQLAQPHQRGPQLGEELRRAAHRLAHGVAARGHGLGQVGALGHEPAGVAARPAQAREHGVRVGDELLDRPALVAQDAQHLRGLAQAGVRSPQHLLEVLRAARQARAQPGHQHPQPLARRAGAARSGSGRCGIVPSVWVTGITASSASRSRAVPGWQSTKYSPISDCGFTEQRGVGAERGHARLGHRRPSPSALGGPVREVFTSKSEVWPARTPPTRKSPPVTSPNALSNTIR